MTTDAAAVRAVLDHYAKLYRARDVARLDEAIELFVPGGEPEMLGTEATERGDSDWAIGRGAVRAITEWDWRYWFDVVLDVKEARITIAGDVAWASLPGALVQSERSREGTRCFVRQTTLTQILDLVADSEQPLEGRLTDIAYVAGSRARELQAPAGHRRALTLTAVLVRRDEAWRFHTTHWSLAAE